MRGFWDLRWRIEILKKWKPWPQNVPGINTGKLDDQVFHICQHVGGLVVWRVFVTFIIRRSGEVQSVTPNLKDNALSPFGFSILFNRKIKFTFTFTIGRHCQSWSSLSPPLQSNSNFRLELQQQEVKARSDNFESQFRRILRKVKSFISSYLYDWE